MAICDLTFTRVYLLCRSKTCPKQVNKELKFIKWTTHWAQKRGLSLTFGHVTWKSIEIIYLLGATPAPSLVLIKWRGQKILSGQHMVYRPTDIPTDRPTVSKPLFQGQNCKCLSRRFRFTGIRLKGFRYQATGLGVF